MEITANQVDNYNTYEVDEVAHSFVDKLTERVNTISDEVRSIWKDGSGIDYAKLGAKAAVVTHAMLKSSSILGLIEGTLAVKGAKHVQNFLNEPNDNPIQNTLGIASNEALAISADLVSATQNRIASHPEVYKDPKMLAILTPFALAAGYYGYNAAVKVCAALELLHLGYLAYSYKDSLTENPFKTALEKIKEIDIKSIPNQALSFFNGAIDQWNQLSTAGKVTSVIAGTAALALGGYVIYGAVTSAANFASMGLSLAKGLGQAHLLYEVSTLLFPKAA